ncbi:hypothetical protein [Tabrizicola soli]|uniref:Uncharacterized protein n=1 Tax=Tabrizicola soli TaxID=2185115 RepID=A0ABV7DU65_9RHOB|nr:hypothetical protein [Tabrizicola soli]
MHNPPPPEGTRPVDGRRVPAPRSRQTGMWLVLAVLAAIIIAILAFSFDRTEPDPAIIPAESPAAPATDGAATDGAATDGAATDGTATDGAAPEGTGAPETAPPATTP